MRREWSCTLSYASYAALLLAVWLARPAAASEPWVIYASKLCGSETPDGTRDRPYPSLIRALEAATVVPNTYPDVKIVLLPVAPDVPYGDTDTPTTVDVPGKTLTISSEGGPSVTGCEALVLQGGQATEYRQVTLEGITFTTEQPQCVLVRQYCRVTLKNCVFSGCATALANNDSLGGKAALTVENSAFYGCDTAFFGYHRTTDDPWAFVNCIFARNMDVLAVPSGYNAANARFDYCAFCGNDRFLQFSSTVSHEVLCPPEGPLFLDPETCNLQLPDDSPLRNAGNPASRYLNPDGTRGDLGAYGGAGALPYWSRAADLRWELSDVQVTPDPETGKVRITVRVRRPIEEEPRP